jgi:hypothetical protein
MKFLTLVKKEFREALPWLLLAALFLSISSWVTINLQISNQKSWFAGKTSTMFDERDLWDKYGDYLKEDDIFQPDIMRKSLRFMFYIPIGLGLILGVRHFFLQGLDGTWQYLIHRSVKKSTIVSSKLVAAALAMSCLVLIWLLFIGYTNISKKEIIPAGSWMVYLGIFYALVGFIVYMGIALCAITKARWYTTRIFGLFSVLIMLLVILSVTEFIYAFIVSVFVFGILIVQIYQTFLQREF